AAQDLTPCSCKKAAAGPFGRNKLMGNLLDFLSSSNLTEIPSTQTQNFVELEGPASEDPTKAKQAVHSGEPMEDSTRASMDVNHEPFIHPDLPPASSKPIPPSSDLLKSILVLSDDHASNKRKVPKT
ncbi:unnamed protein product, partial [Ilex paraguariensis]